MAILESTIGGIIGKLVDKGFSAITAETNAKGELVFTGRASAKGEPETILTLPDFATIRSPKFYLKRISISATQLSKPDEADWIRQNPFEKNMKIYAIGIIPDAVFQTEGKIQINTNDVSFIEETDAAAFTDIVDMNIPIPTSRGLELQRGKSIEVYAWNPLGSAAKVTIAVLIGE